MNKYEQDELKHWKKEFYRTLEEAEQATGQYWASSRWKDDADRVGQEAAAVCFLSFTAFAVGIYLLGLR